MTKDINICIYPLFCLCSLCSDAHYANHSNFTDTHQSHLITDTHKRTLTQMCPVFGKPASMLNVVRTEVDAHKKATG